MGEEALKKVTDSTALEISDPDKLYAATLAGDIVSNAIYYGTTATNHNFASGIAAGIGAIVLPQKMGLNDHPVAENNKKKFMTVGYYIFGAMVTKFIYDKIK